MVTASQRNLASGSPLSLSCSIQQLQSVNTPTTTSFIWTTPHNRHDRTTNVTGTSVELVVPSTETADSGDYVCLVIVTDSSNSAYINDSPPATNYISVSVSE